MDYREIITTDPQVRDGQPCIRGLPITVSDVIGYMTSGMSVEQVLAKHMELTFWDIMACVRFCADRSGDSGGGAAPVPHPMPPGPRGPISAHKKLDKDGDA